MSVVRLESNRIVVDDEQVSLLSGELHYWRLMPEQWPATLRAIRELGLPIVASYVQWQFHEYAEGEFDFTGRTHPSRNLVGFLELVRDHGLWAIVRPGPYTFTEWVNFGVPGYVAHLHRLHPQFLTAASRYIAAVCDALVPYLVTSGGPILLVNADNQIETAEALYEQQLGFDGGRGVFQEFLATKYADIEELNRVWETCYSSFSDARAFTAPVDCPGPRLRRVQDVVEFRSWYTTTYAKWVLEQYAEHGIDVPMYLNTLQVMSDQDPREFAKLVPIVGADPYPSGEFRRGPDEHREFLELIRFNAAVSGVPYLAEFQCGCWHEGASTHPPYPPNHYRLTAVSAIIAGARAWNWYMLVERDNWCLAPINQWGRKRLELSASFERIVRAFEEADVPTCRAVGSTGAIYSYELNATGSTQSVEPVLRALYDAGLDYRFVNLASEIPSAIRLVFYSAPPWLPREHHERLERFVTSGGTLVCFATAPTLDQGYAPYDRLGICHPVREHRASYIPDFRVDVVVDIDGVKAHVAQPSHIAIWSDDIPDGSPIFGNCVKDPDLPQSNLEELEQLRGLIVGRRIVVGYERRVGAGRVIQLGVPPNRDLIGALHTAAGVPPGARSRTHAVHTSLMVNRDQELILAVANIGGSHQVATIELGDWLVSPGRVQLEYLGEDMSARTRLDEDLTLHIPIDRKDGRLIRIRSA